MKARLAMATRAPDPRNAARAATAAGVVRNARSLDGPLLMRGDDGYDRTEAARGRGWSAVASWGLDGWDLGAWPLVVISHRHNPAGFELAYDVEGDITVYRYPTRELRDRATDCLAFWHWKHSHEDWVDGVEYVDVAPDRLRGPFSWERLQRGERDRA
jgi:hypothetical protein